MSQFEVKHPIRYKGKLIKPGTIAELQDALVEHAISRGYVVKIVPAEGGKTKAVLEKPPAKPTSDPAPETTK
jgi:hypothetical protein